MSSIIISTDGGARGNPGPAGIGVVFFSEAGKVLCEFSEYIGKATNNVAEYRALILALKEAESLGYKDLHILMDSELVVRQMQGVYKIKEPALQVLARQALSLSNRFKNVVYRHIPREKNKAADKLVNQVIDAHLGI